MKAPLHLVPTVATALEAVALGEGARKYGPFDWRERGICATEYYDKVLRHMAEWLNGVETDAGSGVSPLANARADIGILLDAIDQGVLKDDRARQGRALL